MYSHPRLSLYSHPDRVVLHQAELMHLIATVSTLRHFYIRNSEYKSFYQVLTGWFTNDNLSATENYYFVSFRVIVLKEDDDDDSIASSILSGQETRSLGLNTLGTT